MMKKRIMPAVSVSLLCVVLLLLHSCGQAPVVQELAADTIFVNGKIITVDKNFSIAEAVAVKKGMIDAGIRVTDSSDAPVTVPNFLHGIEAAVLRESKGSKTPVGPEQAITVREAIANYTINGAWQTHQESVKGSIEKGKLADFCILDKDIMTIDPHEISEAKVLVTVVGGKIVYRAEAGDEK